MIKILVIHGPNLNLLGEREKDIYGKITLDEINEKLKKIAEKEKIQIKIIQSNSEEKIIEEVQRARKNFNGILINPAAFTHTSVAIRDALLAVKLPTVEVHLSNIYSREDFRKISLIAEVVAGQISGLGVNSYILGLKAVIDLVKETKI